MLYHATIYHEIHKYIQESEPAALKYEMVIEKAKAHEGNVLEYKDHQASHRGANSVPSYNNPLLTAHAVARIHVISVANLMSEATAPHMGRPVINARVLIISKPFVIPRLQQPRQCPALTGARSHSHCRDMVLLGATMVMAKDMAGISQRRRHQRSHQSRKHTRLHSRTRSYQKQQLHLVERERMVMYHIKRRSYQDQRKKVHTTSFLALQFTVKWLKAPTLRVSL